MKVVAFDLDGTLVDSKWHLLPAYRKAHQAVGLPVPPDDRLLMGIGGTAEDIHQLFMPQRTKEEYQEYAGKVFAYCMEAAKTGARTYPHIKESLEMLRKEGYKLVLCSNGNVEQYSTPLLGLLGILPLLDHLQPIVAERNKSELLASIIREFECEGHIVMVGDRHYDAQAARDNGVPFIGCRYGLFPAEIDEVHPDVVIEDALQLPAAVKRILGV